MAKNELTKKLMGLFDHSRDDLNFYSKAQKVIAEMPSRQLPKDQVEKYLLSKGVKRQELKEMGLLDFIESHKDGEKISKEGLFDYVEENKWNLGETRLSGEGVDVDEIYDELYIDGSMMETQYDQEYMESAMEFAEEQIFSDGIGIEDLADEIASTYADDYIDELIEQGAFDEIFDELELDKDALDPTELRALVEDNIDAEAVARGYIEDTVGEASGIDDLPEAWRREAHDFVSQRGEEIYEENPYQTGHVSYDDGQGNYVAYHVEGTPEGGYQVYDDNYNHVADATDLDDARYEIRQAFENDHWDMVQNGGTAYSEYRVPDFERRTDNYNEILITTDDMKDNFYGGHEFRVGGEDMNEGNVLFHMRTSDMAKDGKKYLVIEEIQSDLHQHGRRQGYKTPELEARLKKANDDFQSAKNYIGTRFLVASRAQPWLTYNRMREFNNSLPAWRRKPEQHVYKMWQEASQNSPRAGDWVDSNPEMFAAATGDFDLTQYQNALSQLETVRSEAYNAVADAPLKDEKWIEVAMKKALQDAAQNGYDGIVWTNADQQARLYHRDSMDLYKNVYERKAPKAAEKLAKEFGGKLELRDMTGSGQMNAVWELDPAGLEKVRKEGISLYQKPPIAPVAGAAATAGTAASLWPEESEAGRAGLIEEAMKGGRYSQPDKMGFTSRLEDEIAKMKQNKMAPDQIQNYLLQRGVNKREMEDAGFLKFIEDQKKHGVKSIDKESMLDHMDKNRFRFSPDDESIYRGRDVPGPRPPSSSIEDKIHERGTFPAEGDLPDDVMDDIAENNMEDILMDYQNNNENEPAPEIIESAIDRILNTRYGDRITEAEIMERLPQERRQLRWAFYIDDHVDSLNNEMRTGLREAVMEGLGDQPIQRRVFDVDPSPFSDNAAVRYEMIGNKDLGWSLRRYFDDGSEDTAQRMRWHRFSGDTPEDMMMAAIQQDVKQAYPPGIFEWQAAEKMDNGGMGGFDYRTYTVGQQREGEWPTGFPMENRNLAFMPEHNYEEHVFKFRPENQPGGYAGKYQSSHWRKPQDENYLMHMRTTDQRGPNGEKILFVEEMQSDLHQTGRNPDRGGYYTPSDARISENASVAVNRRYSNMFGYPNDQVGGGITYANRVETLRNADPELFRKRVEETIDEKWDHFQQAGMPKEELVDWWMSQPADRFPEELLGGVLPEYGRMLSANDEARRANSALNSGVPDRPFKDDEWQNVAMRRLVKYAADNDYDGIAFTNAKQQEAVNSTSYGRMYHNAYEKRGPKFARKIAQDIDSEVGEIQLFAQDPSSNISPMAGRGLKRPGDEGVSQIYIPLKKDVRDSIKQNGIYLRQLLPAAPVAGAAGIFGSEEADAASARAMKEFAQYTVDADSGAKVYEVSIPNLDEQWKTIGEGWRVPEGGEGNGSIGTRYDDFANFVQNEDVPVHAPRVNISPNGTPMFEDGRHRFSWFRDQGYDSIPMSMDEESYWNAVSNPGLLVSDEPLDLPVTPRNPAFASNKGKVYGAAALAAPSLFPDEPMASPDVGGPGQNSLSFGNYLDAIGRGIAYDAASTPQFVMTLGEMLNRGPEYLMQGKGLSDLWGDSYEATSNTIFPTEEQAMEYFRNDSIPPEQREDWEKLYNLGWLFNPM